MSRVMPRQFFDGVGDYLEEGAADRKEETIEAIKDRADEIAEADAETAVDDPSKRRRGALRGDLALLRIPAAALRQRRTAHDPPASAGDGRGAPRPYEAAFGALDKRKDPLDEIESACRKEEPFYGDGWDIEFVRPRPDLFEMKVHRWRSIPRSAGCAPSAPR